MYAGSYSIATETHGKQNPCFDVSVFMDDLTTLPIQHSIAAEAAPTRFFIIFPCASVANKTVFTPHFQETTDR